MKNFIYLILAGVLISSCAVTEIARKSDPEVRTVTAQEIRDQSFVVIKIGETELLVEAVKSPDTLSKGLGERDSIGSDGMLFVLPEYRVARFWMKGMRFDLDVVWIRDNLVVGVEENVPAPKMASDELPTISSSTEINYVLELDAGKVAEFNIKPGDSVSILQQQ